MGIINMIQANEFDASNNWNTTMNTPSSNTKMVGAGTNGETKYMNKVMTGQFIDKLYRYYSEEIEEIT